MSKKYMLMAAASGAFFFGAAPTTTQAQCLMTQDCEALGYTETSCPDGGIKCPFGDYWACQQKSTPIDLCQSCYIGWILNSDMTCSETKVSGKTPIGVVAQQKITSDGPSVKCQCMAVALNNISASMAGSTGNSKCNDYKASGVTGWHMPTNEELLTVYSNINSVQSGLTKAGGTQFSSKWHWSSTSDNNSSIEFNYYWLVNPVNGYLDSEGWGSYSIVRPVLNF